MTFVTINDAAPLTGKSVKTIYRHIENGKLSCVIDENGRKVIDISELIRAYGKLIEQPESDKLFSMSLDEKINIQLLEQEITHLKAILSEKEKLLIEKDLRNEDLKQALLMLEHKNTLNITKKRKWWQFKA
jgi:hypothetical protein